MPDKVTIIVHDAVAPGTAFLVASACPHCRGGRDVPAGMLCPACGGGGDGRPGVVAVRVDGIR